MLDVTKLYPQGFPPVHHSLNAKFTGFATYTTRTQCSPPYYIIDFGYSRHYNPNELPFDVILAAGDRSAPEIKGHRATHFTRLNPFPFDVYCLVGNILRKDYLIGSILTLFLYHSYPTFCSAPISASPFLLPLVNDMTQEEPSL